MTVCTTFLHRVRCTVAVTFFVICFLCTASFAHADNATQTDWSEGPGVTGPVTDWSAMFDSSSDIRWLAVPGQITLSSTPLLTPRENLIEGSFDGASGVYAADVNGDGHMDVLGAAWNDGVAWWHDDYVWIEHTVDDSFRGNFLCAADMNGDDDVDVVTTGYDMQTDKECITWWENLDDSGTTWLKHTICVDSCEFIAFDIADIDGDGDNDVLGAALFGCLLRQSGVSWWENQDGLGTIWAEHVVNTVSGISGSVFAVDIDGDTDLDVVTVFLVEMFPFEGEFVWYENEDDTGTSWLAHYVDDPWGVTKSCVTDIDSDGDPDVVISAEGAGWWENVDSGATWNVHDIDSFDYASWLEAADIDGDTDVDLFYTGYNNDLGWLEQTEDSAGMMRWVKHELVNTFYGAKSVHAADIDGDADVDIIGAAEDDAELTWWEVTEFKPAGELVSSILDVECDPDWHLIRWTQDVPANTSLRFQVRASDDYTNMGEWSQEMNSPGSLHGVLADRDNYVQYKAILETNNPGFSPTLEDITISWNPLGIEEETAIYSEFVLQPVLPNPVNELATISFTIPHDCHVSIKVFDVSGRCVVTLVDEYVHAGKHTVIFDTHNVASGVYYFRLEGGTFIQTRSCVLVK